MAFSQVQLDVIAKGIRDLDPDGRYVRLDHENRVVSYCDEIVQHERIGNYVGDEEPVRAYVVAWLCTVGAYAPGAIELERRYAFGRGSHLELDIRVSREDAADGAFALVEIKEPSDWQGIADPRIEGQLFAPAGTEASPDVLAYCTLEVGADESLLIRSVTIAHTSALTYTSWVAAGSQHVGDLPINYNLPLPEALANTAGRGLREDLTAKELDRVRRRLHSRLWGGSRDDNQIYAWLVRVLLAKIHDEKTTDEDTDYRFQVLHNGNSIETAAETAQRISVLYKEAHTRYIGNSTTSFVPLMAGQFEDGELQWVTQLLQGISITAAGQASGDLLGSFFEAITRDGFKQSKGLFFTHYNIAVFMLEVLELATLAESKLRKSAHPNERLPYIIDPSCGSGTFLLAAMRQITAHVTSIRGSLTRNAETKEQLLLRFPVEAPNTWAKDFIFGVEKREDLVISTKVNMVLHKDGHTRVYADDGLAQLDDIATRHAEEKFRAAPDPDGIYTKPVSESFDVVVSNPPFSIELDSAVRATLPSTFDLAADRNSENLFLERWYQLLRHGGRLGAVLPESFFSTAENQTARIFLMVHFRVRAVVMLPPHAFQPWTPTRTSLLFATKREADDERKWSASWTRHSAEVRSLFDSARRSLKRLGTPPARYAPATRTADVEAVRQMLSALDVVLSEDEGSSAWAKEAARVLASTNVDGTAFSRVVAEMDDDSYEAIIVEEVGYKRTKRAENDRRNDLFTALQGETGAVVRNLNGAPQTARVVSTTDGDDALSVLRSQSIWA